MKLQDFIFINEQQGVHKKTIKGLFRALCEPLADSNAQGAVLMRVYDTQGLDGLIKRLQFSSDISVIDFSARQNQKQDIFGGVEFIVILAQRFSACFLWDFNGEEVAPYYFLVNSHLIEDVFKVINSNCTEDLTPYLENFKPDRRENPILNQTYLKIIDLLEDSFEEIEAKTLEQDKILEEKRTREVVHEIKNQIGILDLYSTLLDKKMGENEESKVIKRAIGQINAEIDNLKGKSIKLVQKNLADVVFEAVELTKNSCRVEFSKPAEILANVDEQKFIGCLVNIIKNAHEAGGKVKISLFEGFDGCAKIHIENCGKPIDRADFKNIFQSGFSTKGKGRGIGLHLCEKYLKAQNCTISIVKSDEKSTIFEISTPVLSR